MCSFGLVIRTTGFTSTFIFLLFFPPDSSHSPLTPLCEFPGHERCPHPKNNPDLKLWKPDKWLNLWRLGWRRLMMERQVKVTPAVSPQPEPVQSVVSAADTALLWWNGGSTSSTDLSLQIVRAATLSDVFIFCFPTRLSVAVIWTSSSVQNLSFTLVLRRGLICQTVLCVPQ